MHLKSNITLKYVITVLPYILVFVQYCIKLNKAAVGMPIYYISSQTMKHLHCVCLRVWVAMVDDSSPASPFTCFIAVVTSILNSPKDARQAGLADTVLPEENHFVHLGVRFAAGGDHRVGGV